MNGLVRRLAGLEELLVLVAHRRLSDHVASSATDLLDSSGRLWTEPFVSKRADCPAFLSGAGGGEGSPAAFAFRIGLS